MVSAAERELDGLDVSGKFLLMGECSGKRLGPVGSQTAPVGPG